MGVNKKTILLATGQANVDKQIEKTREIEIVGNSPNRESVESLMKILNPETVIIGEGLQGYLSIPQLILKLKKSHENVRFIYLAGEIPQEESYRLKDIKSLIDSGVFDIVHQGQIKRRELIDLINIPRTGIEIDFLSAMYEEPEFEESKNTVTEGISIIDEPGELNYEESEEPPEEPIEAVDEDTGMDRPKRNESANIITISSIKPGTGKSFMAVNIAAAIAEYGENMPDGSRPRVALIEADLQNLSLGTILQIEDKDSRLLDAVKLMKKIMDENEDINVTEDEVLDTNREIKKCFTAYPKIKNLEVLAGSQLSYSEVQRISGNHYGYLIEAMKPNYDYIIIDSNSSIVHASSLPILRKADVCYYVLNLDFNNIRNNIRYQEVLKGMNIIHKVKYILNEDVVAEDVNERLDFGRQNLEELGFVLEAAVPSIPKTIFNNRLFQGVPLVLGDETDVLDAKREIFKVSNQIHPIKDYSEKNINEQKKKRNLFKR